MNADLLENLERATTKQGKFDSEKTAALIRTLDTKASGAEYFPPKCAAAWICKQNKHYSSKWRHQSVFALPNTFAL